MKHGIFALFIYLICVAPVFAGNGSEMIYKTSPEYQAAEFSRIASGKCSPSSELSITRREFRSRFLGASAEADDGFSGSFSGTVTPYAGWFHSPYSKDEKYVPLQMVYLYDRMPDVADLVLSAGYNDSFYAKLTYNVSCSKKSLVKGESYCHPLAGDTYSSGDSPSEGYICFSADHFSIAAGRFKGGVGHGLMGNLFQNGQAPYYDQIQFTFYASKFKYYYMMGSSSAKLTESELNIQTYDSNGWYVDETDPKNANMRKYTTDCSKLFAFHRLEYSPADSLSLGIGELSVVGGKLPDFYMFNPLGIYHDCYDEHYHGYYFSVDATWVPAERHMIFAELLSDQIKAPGERSKDPTAMGYQLAYWYILPLETQTKHRIALEATHVDGWTYVNKTSYLSMYQRQVQRETTSDIPLGYSQGGDCEQLSLIYTAVSSTGLKIDVTLSRLHKGEIGFRTITDSTGTYLAYAKAESYKGRPTGVVEKWSSAECKLNIPFSERLALNMLGHYSFIQNFNHNKGVDHYLAVCTAGLSISF